MSNDWFFDLFDPSPLYNNDDLAEAFMAQTEEEKYEEWSVLANVMGESAPTYVEYCKQWER